MSGMISKQDIRNFGTQFSDREDSFDDSKESKEFANAYRKNRNLLNHLKVVAGTESSVVGITNKPFGQTGIDARLDFEDGNYLLIEFERWKQWDPEWPPHYKYISFLGRKSKLLDRHEIFVFCAFSSDMDKLLIVDSDIIKKYDPIKKYFPAHKRYDMVREIPLEMGLLFNNGGEITNKESEIFSRNSEYR